MLGRTSSIVNRQSSIVFRHSSFGIRHSAFVISFLLSWAPAAVQAQFPYEGIVNVERSLQVRSGPSENHYRTGILKRGDRVKVVGQPADGWLAIEPPPDSFSWISGQYIREVSPTEGEAASDKVNVRVGTPINEELRDTVQVQLARGDRVRILDRKTSGQGVLAKVWYKVASPPGEVRYVKSEFIQAADGRRAVPRPAPPRLPAKSQEPANTPTTSKHSREEVREEVKEPPEEPDGPQTPVNATPAQLLEQASAAYEAEIRKALGERNLSTARALYEQAAKVVDNDADQMLIARRLSQIEDQEARKAKLEEFERILRRSRERDQTLLSLPRDKQGRQQAEANGPDGGKAQGSGVRGQGSGVRGQNPPQGDAPKYDGSGILRRSTAKIDGKPAYILASPSGGIIRYYVTPGPGVDLTPYEEQTVAVRGSSGYRPELQRQHIVVREVTPIELKR